MTSNLDLAAALDRIGGDRALLAEIARLFLGEYPALLAQIHAAHQRGDAQQLERAAHSLKGSAANFGARRVVESAFAVERLGKAGDLSAAGPAIAELEAELATIKPELDEVAGQHAG
jgi:HPt (histidine-containing phosphotransfer) domain-containing protein